MQLRLRINVYSLDMDGCLFNEEYIRSTAKNKNRLIPPNESLFMMIE